jgi:hypothetical protein
MPKKSMVKKTLSEVEAEISREEEAYQKRKKKLELERSKKIDKVSFWLGEYMIQKDSFVEDFLKDKTHMKGFSEMDIALIKDVVGLKNPKLRNKWKEAEEGQKVTEGEQPDWAEHFAPPDRETEAEAEEARQKDEAEALHSTPEAPKADVEKTEPIVREERIMYLRPVIEEEGNLVAAALEEAFGPRESKPKIWGFDTRKKVWCFGRKEGVEAAQVEKLLGKWLPKNWKSLWASLDVIRTAAAAGQKVTEPQKKESDT